MFLLQRLTSEQSAPCIGSLIHEGIPIFLTLEPPLGRKLHPAIPQGKYECIKVKDRVTNGGTFIPVTFILKDVPGRKGILFHIGNTERDTQGCICLGMEIGNNMILKSKIAFGKFIILTQDVEKFSLEIRDARK